jgi:hypothetical protein
MPSGNINCSAIGKQYGPKRGADAVASGQLASICHLGGLRSAEVGHCAKQAPYAAHARWHRDRNIINPKCSFCADVPAASGNPAQEIHP